MADMAAGARQALENVCCELCSGTDEEALFVVTDRYGDRADEFPVVRCTTCRLVYVNPRPTSESISSFYPTEYFDAEVFHQDVPAGALPWLESRRLEDISRFAKGGCILDVGCGAGQFLAAAKAHGWKTCGIEVSDLAASHAREHHKLDVIQKDLLEAELPDEHFDVVTMWGVLEHLHHPKAALQEVSRILKPGGLFIALLPNIGSTQARIFGANWYLLDVPRHLYHFSEATLRRMALCADLPLVWGRFYAAEHDVPNLVKGLQTALHVERCNVIGQGSRPSACEPKRWTGRRVLMGVLRRAAPVLARAIAGRRSSAAMEAYFVKPG